MDIKNHQTVTIPQYMYMYKKAHCNIYIYMYILYIYNILIHVVTYPQQTDFKKDMHWSTVSSQTLEISVELKREGTGTS